MMHKVIAVFADQHTQCMGFHPIWQMLHQVKCTVASILPL